MMFWISKSWKIFQNEKKKGFVKFFNSLKFKKTLFLTLLKLFDKLWSILQKLALKALKINTPFKAKIRGIDHKI